MDEKPIARCEANGVEAYTYPFYLKPAGGMEPAYIFLEDHVYNFLREEMEAIMPQLVTIRNEQDLQELGFQKDRNGVYIVSRLEEPWLRGGRP